jgi:glycosyltransferase 2 family protein
MQTKNKIISLLKIIVGLSLLGIIFSKINWNNMLIALKNAQWGLLLLSFGILLLRNWISGLRWKQLLSSKGINVSLRKLVKYYFLANFFGFFFPSAVGGDIPRAFYLQREINHLEESISSIVVERLLGILASIFLCFFALLAGRGMVAFIGTGSIIFIAILVIIATWILFRFPLSWLQGMRISKLRLIKKTIDVIQTLQEYQSHSRALWEGFALSLLFQLFMVVCTYLLSLALGEKTSFLYFLLILPVTWVVSLIPISFNGIGTREGTFIYLFVLAGMKTEAATAISLLNLLMMVGQGLVGAVIFLIENKGFSHIEVLDIQKETVE